MILSVFCLLIGPGWFLPQQTGRGQSSSEAAWTASCIHLYVSVAQMQFEVFVHYNKNNLDILSKNRTFFESPCFISENLLKCVQSMNESSGTCAPGEVHNYLRRTIPMKMISRRSFMAVAGAATAAVALTACGGSSSTASSTASSAAASAVAKLDKVKVAVPNDTTNEARALTLLEKNGFFKLKADAGLTATAKDIEENPLNVTVDEVEAAQVPNVLQDEDYAVINSNYAISAGLDPTTDALAIEDGSSAYVNVLVCKDGNQEEPKIKALAAALQSQQVKDFMDENYKGAVVSAVENPTDGYDASVDYDALNGETVSCAATPAPHCEVLEVCKEILAAKGITLDIQEYDDYIIPNNVVEDGTVDTNYFQHQPYLDDFNAEHGTHLVTVAGIHVEPMGIYGGKQDSLAPIEG